MNGFYSAEDLARQGVTEFDAEQYYRRLFLAQGLSSAEVNNIFADGGNALHRTYTDPRYQSLSKVKRETKSGLLSFFKYGYQNSLLGLYTRDTLPDAVSQEEIQNASFLQRLAAGFGGFAGDAPAFIASALAAPFTGGSSIALGAATFAGLEGLKAAKMYDLEKGAGLNIETSKLDEVTKAALTGGIIGAVLGPVGKFGANTAAKGFAKESIKWGGKEMTEAVGGKTLGASLGVGAGRIGAETAWMGTAGPILEGRMPEINDYVDNAALMIGMNALHSGSSYLRTIAFPNAVHNSMRIVSDTGLSLGNLWVNIRNNPDHLAWILQNKGIPKALRREAQALSDATVFLQRTAPESVSGEGVKGLSREGMVAALLMNHLNGGVIFLDALPPEDQAKLRKAKLVDKVLDRSGKEREVVNRPVDILEEQERRTAAATTRVTKINKKGEEISYRVRKEESETAVSDVSSYSQEEVDRRESERRLAQAQHDAHMQRLSRESGDMAETENVSLTPVRDTPRLNADLARAERQRSMGEMNIRPQVTPEQSEAMANKDVERVSSGVPNVMTSPNVNPSELGSTLAVAKEQARRRNAETPQSEDERLARLWEAERPVEQGETGEIGITRVAGESSPEAEELTVEDLRRRLETNEANAAARESRLRGELSPEVDREAIESDAFNAELTRQQEADRAAVSPSMQDEGLIPEEGKAKPSPDTRPPREESEAKELKRELENNRNVGDRVRSMLELERLSQDLVDSLVAQGIDQKRAEAIGLLAASHARATCDLFNMTPEQYMRERSPRIIRDLLGENRVGQEKGSYGRTAEGKGIIWIFESGDESTAVHELGHHWLEELREAVKYGRGEAGAEAEELLARILDEFGIKGKDRALSDPDVLERVHERFARELEAYLRKGEARSTELTGVFERFRTWLKQIYETWKSLWQTGRETPPSEEMQDIFDRLIYGKERGYVIDNVNRGLYDRALKVLRAERDAKKTATTEVRPTPTTNARPRGGFEKAPEYTVGGPRETGLKDISEGIVIRFFQTEATTDEGLYTRLVESEDVAKEAGRNGRYIIEKALGKDYKERIGKHHAVELNRYRGKDEQDFTGSVDRFVEEYIADPKAAVEKAPGLIKALERGLQKNDPELYDLLSNAKDLSKSEQTQHGVEVIRAGIKSGPDKVSHRFLRLDRLMTFNGLYTSAIDSLHPVFKLVEYASKKLGLEFDADQNVAKLMRLGYGVGGKVSHFLEYGTLKFDTLEKNGESYKDILNDARRNGVDLSDLSVYLVAQRAIDMNKNGHYSGFTTADATEAVNALRGTCEEYAQRIHTFETKVLDYFQESGMLSKETRDIIQKLNEHYVPFHRVFMNTAEAEAKIGTRGATKLKTVKGSQLDVYDPLETIISNTYTMVHAAEKNHVAVRLAELAGRMEEAELGAGSYWCHEVPMGTNENAITAKKLRAALDLGVVEESAVRKVLGDGETRMFREIATFWQAANGVGKDNSIVVWKDGKAHKYVLDPEIAKVFDDVDSSNVGAFTKLLGKGPTMWLRRGAVLSPDFMLRNPIRDAITTALTSKYGFVPGWDTMKGLYHVIKKDKVYQDFLKSGGAQSCFFSLERNKQLETYNALTESKFTEKVWNSVKHPIDFLLKVAEISENATRVGDFARGLRADANGATSRARLEEIGFNVRDNMDFARMGRDMKGVNQLIAFFNPTIQGTEKMWRTAKENPKQLLVRAALYIGAPTVALTLYNWGDEDMREIPKSQKDMFWMAGIGDGPNKVILKIPKPFEMGVLFGSTLERTIEFCLDYMNDKNGGDTERTLKEAYRGLGASIFTALHPSALPTAVLPVVENWANKSTYTGLPIVPAYLEKVIPEEQATEHTSQLARWMSRAVGQLPAVGELGTFSPAKAENYVRAWGGGLGTYVLQLTDFAARQMGVLPNPSLPEGTLADMPVIKAFVMRHPSMQAESIQQLYENARKVEQLIGTYKLYNRMGNMTGVDEYGPYQVFEPVLKTKAAIGQLVQAIRETRNLPGFSPEEKRKMIESMYYQAIQMSQLGNDQFYQILRMSELEV